MCLKTLAGCRPNNVTFIQQPMLIPKVYIVQSGRSIQIRLKEHGSLIRLAQTDKSAVVEHSTNHGHSINNLKPNDLKKRRTAQLTSRCCILYIY